MKRCITILLLLALAGIPGVFADTGFPEPVYDRSADFPEARAGTSLLLLPGIFDVGYLWANDPGNPGYLDNPVEFVEFVPIMTLAAAASSDSSEDVPRYIRNNQYYLESLRLTLLAQESYDFGDYDASTGYAAEALRYSQLSDEYVALQLKIKQADDSIATARSRLEYAAGVGAARRYSSEYNQAQSAFQQAQADRAREQWDDAIHNASLVIAALANVQAESQPLWNTEQPVPAAVNVTPSPANNNSSDGTFLPAQYTVRPWAVSKDCFWNIAGRPWVYNDPTKWQIIYNANRAKLTDPNNPNLIHPGLVLDIPSLQGEARQGMWSAGASYTPLR
ncbi:hypothetical protein FACS1894151_05580 [Spirochaetia bacterium]|nr:hypothetical protein FACS1894151_05580 [Spirochaetia bacterium]